MASQDDINVSKTTGDENVTTTTTTTSTETNGTTTTTSITLQLTITALPGAPRVPLVLSLSNDPTNIETTNNIMNSTELRQKVATITKIPLSNLRLIYRGRLITDNDTMNAILEYKLEDGSVLHCMGKPIDDITTSNENTTVPVPGTATTTTTTRTTTTTPSSSTIAPSAQATTSVPSSIATTITIPSLQTALDRMRTSNTSTVYTKALKTIQKILSNIIDHPLEEKYRTIKVSNPAFQQKLIHVIGHDIVLRACGFTVINNESTNHQMAYTMMASSEQWPTLLQSKSIIDTALQRVTMNHTSNTSSSTSTAPMIPSTTGTTNLLPPFPNRMNPLIPTDPNVIQQQLRNVLSNPQQFTAMMQVRKNWSLYISYNEIIQSYETCHSLD
jgi:hypothetical protein